MFLHDQSCVSHVQNLSCIFKFNNCCKIPKCKSGFLVIFIFILHYRALSVEKMDFSMYNMYGTLILVQDLVSTQFSSNFEVCPLIGDLVL